MTKQHDQVTDADLLILDNATLNTNGKQIVGVEQEHLDKKPSGPREKLRVEIVNRKQSLIEVASQYADVDRIISSICEQMVDNPKLSQCTPVSMVRAATQLVKMGLEAGGERALAWVIPQNINKGSQDKPHWVTEAQVRVGYRGLIAVAYRTSVVAAIQAHLVFQADDFEYEIGTDERITHRPSLSAERTEDTFLAAYAVAVLPSGYKLHQVMTKAEINKIRDNSQAYSKGYHTPWKSDYLEMARKTAIRRLMKLLPSAPEVDAACEAADLESGYSFDTSRMRARRETIDQEGTDAIDALPGGDE